MVSVVSKVQCRSILARVSRVWYLGWGVTDIDANHWHKAIDTMIQSIYSNKVWDFVAPPKGIKPIGCKWVYKRKRRVDGKVETYKARLVAKGFTQKERLS